MLWYTERFAELFLAVAAVFANTILIRQRQFIYKILWISRNIYVIITRDFMMFYLCGDTNFFIFFSKRELEVFEFILL